MVAIDQSVDALAILPVRAGETRAADHRNLPTRLIRCMGVSVVSTTVCLTVLVAATAGLGLAAWWANILATTIATVPSYHLNRRWTWGRTDASDLWREVMPFWLLAFAGLVLSTISVGVADTWAAGAHIGGSLRTLITLGAHLAGFGVLWGIQFVLLDRALFGRGAAITR